jgi:hypothetical protein
VRFDGAVGGLEELRQRKRRLERERACALFLADLKGVPVRGFGPGGIAPGENVAAKAMQVGVHPMAGGLLGQLETFCDRGERVVDGARSPCNSARRPYQLCKFCRSCRSCLPFMISRSSAAPPAASSVS